MDIFLLITFCIMVIVGPFILYFSRYPANFHRFLIFIKKSSMRKRFKGSHRDFVYLCSHQIYREAIAFSNIFMNLDFCKQRALKNALFLRYLYVSAVYIQSSFLDCSVNKNFAMDVMKNSFNIYHETILGVSSFLNGNERDLDNGIIRDIEMNVCSSEEIEPNIYYYKMIMLMFIRSSILNKPSDISTAEVSPLVDSLQTWSDISIKELALTYDSIRPFLEQ